MAYTAAVITVSDKGSKGERADTSGPMLVSLLQAKGYDVVYTKIIPDEKDDIKAELINCADELNISLVLTTGGTGFAGRDITPEATMEVIEKETPGIPELMRAESAKITNRACLSRSKAGIRKSTLIINLPGSEKAARENFEAVADALDHGMDMLASVGSADCAVVMQPSAATVKVDSAAEPHREKLTGKLGKMFKSQPYKQHNVGGESQLFFDLSAEGYGAEPQNEPADEMSAMLNDIFNDEAVVTAPEAPIAPAAVSAAAPAAEKEYIPLPDGALAKTQTYNAKKLPPRIDLWLREAKQSPYADKCGMFLTHNGVVRADAKSKVREGDQDAMPVTGMQFSYNETAVLEAIENAYQMPGIYFVKVWLNEGTLDVGDDIMFVLIGGDIRPRVIEALNELVGTIKTLCVEEIELY